MDTELLKAEIERREREALGFQSGDLAQDRAASLGAYLGQPYGNEVVDRSQLVTSDVADAIEGIMPGLVRVFTSGDQICEFEAVGPEDVEGAEQETLTVNYVITQQNRFLPFLQSWLRDGLISKVGYVKAMWDDSQTTEEETYSGLSEEELVLLLQDPGVQVVEQMVSPEGEWSIKVAQTKGRAQVRLYNCPPEEILVTPDHTEVSVREVSFIQHRPRLTISTIRAM